MTLTQWFAGLAALDYAEIEREALLDAAAEATATARLRIHNVSGELARTLKTEIGAGRLTLYSEQVYAAQVEYGGIIRTRRARYLSIPNQSVYPVGTAPRSPRLDSARLFFVRFRSGTRALATRLADGALQVRWWLVKSVRQAGKPYLRPGIESAAQTFGDSFSASLAEVW